VTDVSEKLTASIIRVMLEAVNSSETSVTIYLHSSAFQKTATDQHFRGASITRMMEAESSEMSVYLTTRCNIPQDTWYCWDSEIKEATMG
jgi:hypothetical protein